MASGNRTVKTKPPRQAENYQHPEADSPMRPEVGTQAQFKKKKPPQTYRYDSSLSPELEWDGQNAAREAGEVLIKELGEWGLRLAELAKVEPSQKRDKEIAELKRGISDAQSRLRKISGAFLNWSGKAERLSFDVPTLPLFIHERLSTKAIVETLKGHRSDKQEDFFRELWGDPQHSVTDQVLRAYEYRDDWVNRMILGDSLVAMNSLLSYESLGGQVQMIYMDPPYGVKFGSNFQPFVRKRDVAHNDDEDMTREPEMVQAYRDTWELGLHSYLTYLRDRLLLARELLHPSGSIFVQISDENLHHVREVMDEVLGAENFCRVISVEKTSGQSSELPAAVCDFLLWYAKDKERAKVNKLFVDRDPFENPNERYVCVERPDGKIIDLSVAQKLRQEPIPEGRILKLIDLSSQTGGETSRFPIEFGGKSFVPSGNRGWSTNREGIEVLRKAGRLHVQGSTIWWKSYRDEFPFRELTTHWPDAKSNAFGGARIYVVQTNPTIIERCLLMTTDPGDLVLDPTCGSGTTAYVAEQWGRRWITMDTSRVPLALARQRLLTATFPFYEINERQGAGVRGQGAGAELSGPGGVAAGDATGQGGVSGHAGVSAGGALRAGEPNAPGGGVGAEQHRGGAHAAHDGGISAVPGAGAGFAGGSGNAGAFGAGTGPAGAGSGGGLAPAGRGNEPRPAWSGPLPDPQPLTADPFLPNNPAAGFVYKRKQNSKGEETGGIVPHITLKSIANNEPPAEEVLVDRPEVKSGIVRVTGPFAFEATIPTPVDWEGDGEEDSGAVTKEDYGSFVDRMIEVLRKSPVLRLEGNRTVHLKNIRPPARSLSLSAEAVVDARSVLECGSPLPLSHGTPAPSESARGLAQSKSSRPDEAASNGHSPVAIVFGPENGAVSEKLVYEAAREAHAKSYTHLYAIGFAIQPNARELIEKCAEVVGVPATYVQATPDLMMGDLLKNMRSSQIFSVCGLPDVKLSKVKEAKVSYKSRAEQQYQVELLGMDVFDPISMEVDHQSGNDVPAWFLDTNYNGLCFHVTQAFFPKTGAWESLKKALKGDYEETVWDHLAGTTSAPFAAGEHGQIAVKVIDQRGNELLVVKSLKEAK